MSWNATCAKIAQVDFRERFTLYSVMVIWVTISVRLKG